MKAIYWPGLLEKLEVPAPYVPRVAAALAQALSVGRLGADEVAVVVEYAPRVATALCGAVLATHCGVLRAMAERGEVTAEHVRAALGLPAVDEWDGQGEPPVGAKAVVVEGAVRWDTHERVWLGQTVTVRAVYSNGYGERLAAVEGAAGSATVMLVRLLQPIRTEADKVFEQIKDKLEAYPLDLNCRAACHATVKAMLDAGFRQVKPVRLPPRRVSSRPWEDGRNEERVANAMRLACAEAIRAAGGEVIE